ncbi:hypothetical protein G6F56_013166 [Rhizopus delemar]|nr:hypothetical protein G6F56_013166 [Rhizopus delemar]
MVRPSFVASLAKWKSRQEIPGRYMDIYDGAVWKAFKTDPTHHVPFVEESIFNLMLTLNNVLLVGLIPGPSETKVAEISNFLDPLVEELLTLQHGVLMHTHSNGVVNVKAALSIVGCDLPAAKKVSGFTAIN